MKPIRNKADLRGVRWSPWKGGWDPIGPMCVLVMWIHEGPRKTQEIHEGPGGPRMDQEGPIRPRKVEEDPGSPGNPRKSREARKSRKAQELPGKSPRKAQEGPGQSQEGPGKPRKTTGSSRKIDKAQEGTGFAQLHPHTSRDMCL